MSEPIFKLPPFTMHLRLSAADTPQIDWGLKLVGVPNAWKYTRGAGVKVAILDTGVDLSHPDLVGGLVAAKDFTGNRYGAQDGNGHGTHCAGIVGARGRIVGVAPECSLYIGKVLGDDGSGVGQAIAAGIDWAVEQDVDVISMSLGSPQQDSRITAALKRAAAAGIILTIAAGNDGRSNSVNWPAKMPEAIAVSAVDERGQIAPYSSRGPEVSIAAPGSNITSTYPGGGSATLSGTSMATPFIAGLEALGAADSNIAIPKPRTKQEVLSRFAAYVRDAGTPGRDDLYGIGVADLSRIVAPTPPVVPSPVTPTPGVGSLKSELAVIGGRTGLFVWAE